MKQKITPETIQKRLRENAVTVWIADTRHTLMGLVPKLREITAIKWTDPLGRTRYERLILSPILMKLETTDEFYTLVWHSREEAVTAIFELAEKGVAGLVNDAIMVDWERTVA